MITRYSNRILLLATIRGITEVMKLMRDSIYRNTSKLMNKNAQFHHSNKKAQIKKHFLGHLTLRKEKMD